MQKESIKSMLYTFFADFAVEIVGGIAAYVGTGDFAQAAVMAAAVSIVRHALKVALERLQEHMNG